MKAIIIRQFGGRDVLEMADIPKPTIGPNEILVKVRAAGVNPVDVKIREGLLKSRMPFTLPITLGWDAAGTVESVGAQVTGFKPGDAVFAYCRKEQIRDGAYAELIALEPRHLARKPQNLSFEEAAAIPLAGLTAFQSLFESIGLKAGETILIHAGAGGVGGFAIQLAKNAGAFVVTTAGARNHEFARSLGADQVIDYSREDFVDAVRRLHPRGVDAVFDTVGGEVQKRSADVLKDGGRLTSILALDGQAFKGKPVKTGYVFVRPEAAQLDQLRQLAEQGKLKVHLDAVLPLSQAAQAHERVESRHTRGKIVLLPES